MYIEIIVSIVSYKQITLVISHISHYSRMNTILTKFEFFFPNPVNKFDALISACTYSCS